MRAVIQRVDSASVYVRNNLVASIGKGLLVLLGVQKEDSEKDVKYIVDKVVNLRIFEDENGKMNFSVKDVGGEVLLVSQFTLLASTRRGRRPDFTSAAPPDVAEGIFQLAFSMLNELVPTKKGIFGEKMLIHLINNGPVTIIVDSRKD
ncbi:MAG: D-aminoacyl-tRNA deacylase [bacterium]|nr:MAG: D-tyrosyl-tRNA(Tyr) deacylase [Fervidicoccus sp.]